MVYSVVAQPVNVECYGVRPTLIWQVDEQMSRFAAAAGEFLYWRIEGEME